MCMGGCRPQLRLAAAAVPPSQSRRRQQTRISAIEAELQRLQKEMASVKLENQRLKAKASSRCARCAVPAVPVSVCQWTLLSSGLFAPRWRCLRLAVAGCLAAVSPCSPYTSRHHPPLRLPTTESGGGAAAAHAGAAAAAGSRRQRDSSRRHGHRRPGRRRAGAAAATAGGCGRHLAAQQPAQAADAPDGQRAASGCRGAWAGSVFGAKHIRCCLGGGLVWPARWLTPAISKHVAMLGQPLACMLLRHRPQMLKVAALTWPRLHDWYCAQHARFR